MPKVPEEQISPHLLKLIGVRGLCDRYGGISLRTIDRWLDKKIIPPPDRMISGRRYWLVEELRRVRSPASARRRRRSFRRGRIAQSV